MGHSAALLPSWQPLMALAHACTAAQAVPAKAGAGQAASTSATGPAAGQAPATPGAPTPGASGSGSGVVTAAAAGIAGGQAVTNGLSHLYTTMFLAFDQHGCRQVRL